MTPLDVVCLLFGAAGFAFGFRCYLELWRWARLISRAQLAVAYKNKVKLSPPLQEVALWAGQLKPGETGRTFYSLGGTRIAILRGAVPNSLHGEIRQWIRAKIGRKRTVTSAPRVRQGTWSAQDDKTGARGGNRE